MTGLSGRLFSRFLSFNKANDQPSCLYHPYSYTNDNFRTQTTRQIGPVGAGLWKQTRLCRHEMLGERLFL